MFPVCCVQEQYPIVMQTLAEELDQFGLQMSTALEMRHNSQTAAHQLILCVGILVTLEYSVQVCLDYPGIVATTLIAWVLQQYI